jgi:hypothetical protein
LKIPRYITTGSTFQELDCGLAMQRVVRSSADID